jgi:hypothetical protein
MHRRHTRRKVLAIYLRAQAGILRRRVHSAISRFVTQPRIRALVIDGLRMKPRVRWPEELRLRFPARRRRLRRRFHFGPRRDLHCLIQKPAGFILRDHLGKSLLLALAVGPKRLRALYYRIVKRILFQTRRPALVHRDFCKHHDRLNAEDEVDDEERCGYEDRRARQRRSECLGVALKAGLERERRVQLFFNRLNSAYCLRIIWGENRAQVRSEPEKTVSGGKPLILISNFTHRARRGACLRFGQYAKRSPVIP